MTLPVRVVRRRLTSDATTAWPYERALSRSGFQAVAGIDEAGRGACAGPLVVAAAILGFTTRGVPSITELNDSKLLTAAARERVAERVKRAALAYSIVVIDHAEVDELGLHVANIQGMRRALARLDVRPDYVLTDGFAVPGLATPSLAVWKGDQVCANVAAAGVLAKVTRDRMMQQLHQEYPQYGFDEHKGYVTAAHRQALSVHGPSPVHRYCFRPVRQAHDRHTTVDVRTALSTSSQGAA